MLPSLPSLAGPALVALGLAVLLVVAIRSSQRSRAAAAAVAAEGAGDGSAPGPTTVTSTALQQDAAPTAYADLAATDARLTDLEAEVHALRDQVATLTELVGRRPTRSARARESRETRRSERSERSERRAERAERPARAQRANRRGRRTSTVPGTAVLTEPAFDPAVIAAAGDGAELRYAVDLDDLEHVLPTLQAPSTPSASTYEPEVEPVLTMLGTSAVTATVAEPTHTVPGAAWVVPASATEPAVSLEAEITIGGTPAGGVETGLLPAPTSDVSQASEVTGASEVTEVGEVGGALPVLDLGSVGGWDALPPVGPSVDAPTWAAPPVDGPAEPRLELQPLAAAMLAPTMGPPTTPALPDLPVLPVIPVLETQPERAVETTAERPVAPVATAGYSEMSRELAAAGRLRDAVLAQWAADLRVLAPLLGDRVSRLSRSLQSITPSDPATMLGSARAVAVMLADQSRLAEVIPSLDDLGHLSRRLVLATDRGDRVPAREPDVPHAELAALETVLVRSAEAGGDGGHVSVSLRWDLITHLASGVDHRVVRALLRETLEAHERDAFDAELAAVAR